MPAKVLQGFLLEVGDRPGALHTVTQRLAEAGVNISGIAGAAVGGRAIIALVTENSLATRDVLREVGVDVRAAEFLAVTARDEPGELDRYLTTLADAGLNVVSLFPIIAPEPTLAFAVDDPVKGREVMRSVT